MPGKYANFFTKTSDIYIQTAAIFAIYISKLSGQMFRHARSVHYVGQQLTDKMIQK